MPYQVSGQAVATKSHRLPHDAGVTGAAAGGGALVGMSAALAPPNGAAMSNAETPIIPSEVRFMVFSHLKAVHCLHADLCTMRSCAAERSWLLRRFSAPCCGRGTVCSAISRPDRLRPAPSALKFPPWTPAT